MKHSLLAMLIALLYACTLHAQNREADSLALVHLYCTTNGLFWTNTWELNTLGTPPPMDEWYGVTTSLIGGEMRVTSLDLHNNNLSGMLETDIIEMELIEALNLTELRYLDLSENHLTDAIPDLTHISNLEELYLNDNHFTADMPNSGLVNLRIMNLADNYLTTIPDFTGLAALEELYLDGNHITSIPNAITLDMLDTLNLADNHLFGTIPNITGLPLLEYLNLDNNHLSGTLPNFSNLDNLIELRINYNYLSGEVTDLMLPTLEKLYLEGNRLTSVPNFTAISNLQILDLDRNSLDTVPNFDALPNLLNLYLAENRMSSVHLFGGLVSLNKLHLNDNCLSGTVPDFETPTLDDLLLHNNFFTELIDFTDLNELEELDLSNTNLQGTIPNFMGLNSIKKLNLSHNCLSGEIPEFNEIDKIEELYLSHNSLTGDIPDCEGLTNLVVLDLSYNQLDDEEIPDFSLTVDVPTDPDACPLSRLKKIYLNNNMLSGQIPHFEQLYGLEILDLSYNNFSGGLPSFDVIVPTFNDDIILPTCEFPYASGRLQILRLNNNNLDGDIDNVANLVELIELNLSHNKNDNSNGFTGNIPNQINSLDTLSYLYLNNNSLNGPIPPIGNMVKLRELNLSHNNLSGNIPDSINQLENLLYIHLNNNQLDELPLSINNLTLLQNLYLNSNNISGPIQGAIPENYFSGLHELRVVNLGYNNFSGAAPSMQGTRPNATATNPDPAGKLTELHLNNNNFSGTIPDFIDPNQLSKLYLDNNNLGGMIPSFDSLDKLDILHLDNNQFNGISPNFAGHLNSSIDYLTLYDNLQLTGCYDPSLYVLRYKNFDSDSISDGTNFDTTWDVFRRYNTDGCDCAHRDRGELMCLYNGSGVQGNGMQGGNWSNNTNWGTTEPLDQWYGITVNDKGCVIGIDLHNNNLNGNIPGDMLLLDLENLNLSNNPDIEGGIPQWIAELDSLENIDLSDCSLSGCLPEYLNPLCGNPIFSNTTISNGNDDLEIWSDFCNGEECGEPLPECAEDDRNQLIAFYEATNGCDNWIIKWDTDLLSLEDWHGVTVDGDGCVTGLNLINNGLAGEMPQDMSLSALTTLNLSNNDLLGPLPTFDETSGLQSINLSNNHFSGTIPNFQLDELTSLNLSSNALTSAPNNIPDFSGMPALSTLNLSYNFLSGQITNFSNLQNLQKLYLYHNDLTGTIPPFETLTALTDLELYNNNLNGSIPNFNLPQLNDIQLQYNNLEGSIPNFTYLSSLNSLNLSNNNLSNTIPDFDSLYNLSGLNLSSNNLIDVIPNFYNLPKLFYLNANNNNLSGEIPDFTNSMNFNDLRIYNNNLTGEIPQAFGQSNIRALIIHSNLLSGCYDPSLRNLCDNLYPWSNQNNDISDDNAFIIPWEDFCNDAEFFCDSFDLRITLDTTKITTCDNNDGSITLNVEYGQPPYQFEWSEDALTTFDPNNLSEGTYSVTVTDCYGGMATDSVKLTMPISPTIDGIIDVTQAYCNGTGSFTATASGGMPNHWYSIDNVDFQQNGTFNDLQADTFTLYVRDALNCRDTTTVIIEGSLIPQIEVIAPLSTCEDEAQGGFTVDLITEGTAPYEYSANGIVQSDNVFSGFAPGNYTITVQDFHGCENTTTADVIALPLPQIQTIDTIPACGLDEGQIIIQADGGTGTLDYYLNDTIQPNDTFTGLGAGTYNITVEDANGCTATDQVELAALQALEINTVIDNATCQDNNGQIITNVTGGIEDYQYWLGGVLQDSNIFPVLAGDTTYNISIVDAIGCKKEITEYVGDTPLPVIDNIEVIDATCQIANASIEVFASAGSGDFMYFIESDTHYVSVIDSLAGDVNGLAYSIIVTDQYDCEATEQITIYDTPRVDFDTIYIDPTCGEENGRIEIDVMSGTHPYTYDFNGGVNEVSSAGGLPNDFIDFTDLVGGEYSVIITDSVGCLEDTLVTLAISDALSINVETINYPCIGDDNCGEIQINLSGWNNPLVANLEMNEDSIFCVPVDTTFFIITDNDGCEREEYIYFDPFEYQSDVSPESAELRIGDNQVFEIINAEQADWSSEHDPGLNNLDFENNFNLKATFTAPPYTDNNNGCEQSITYKIVAYNEAGNCKDTLILTIRVANAIKIPPGITPNGDDKNDVLEIPIFNKYDNIKFVIFNRWGDRVYEFIQKEGISYQGNEWDGTYHKNGVSTGRKLPDADYFYTLQFGNCLKIQRGTVFIR